MTPVVPITVPLTLYGNGDDFRAFPYDTHGTTQPWSVDNKMLLGLNPSQLEESPLTEWSRTDCISYN